MVIGSKAAEDVGVNVHAKYAKCISVYSDKDGRKYRHTTFTPRWLISPHKPSSLRSLIRYNAPQDSLGSAPVSAYSGGEGSPQEGPS